MASKPDGKHCVIREQIIEDLVSGLTLQFEVVNDGTARLRILGDLGVGNNREFIFDKKGHLGATGSALSGVCKPSWLKTVKG